MSHFVVAVVTSTNSEVELAKTLQPYHEYECTGIEDEYVKDIDRTQEALDEFAKATVTRLRGPDGVLHNRFDENGAWKPEFSQEKPHSFIPSMTERVAFVPDGYTKVEIPASDVESAAEWISGYYGWPIVGKENGENTKYGRIELNLDGSVAKCIDRTNPEKKWDWWQIGGRYDGLLLTKGGKSVNQAQKSDIDFARMRSDAEQEAAKEYDKAIEVIANRPIPNWENFRENLFPENIDEARNAYRNDPVMIDWNKAYPDNFFGPNPSDYAMSREAFIEQEGDNSFRGFAILDANGWHEKGSMGWFGCVSDEQETSSWAKQKQTLLAAIPDDHYITMVDCHI